MTHILIPINKINDEIARLTFSNTSYQEREESAMIEGRIFSLDSILTDYKQISLDEKDIEDKILKAYDDTQLRDELGVYTLAYKQALKDLL